MADADTSGLVTDMAGLLTTPAGTHLGFTEWQQMTQQQVNDFADATGDHQWIHVDVERARNSAFGGTVAHGFLTLSLVAQVSQKLLTVTDHTTGINYGLDRVRFPAPMPVGCWWRGSAELVEIGELAGGTGGAQIKVLVRIEVRDVDKPACVAESLVRLLK
jgi:acyl dehydratase